MVVQVVNTRIDTLKVNARGELLDDLSHELERLKDIARETEQETVTPWSFNDEALYLRTAGSAQFPWVLVCPSIRLEVGKGKLNGIIGKVTFSSLYLHSMDEGEGLGQVHRFLIAFFQQEPTLQVSEVHLCADVAGWVVTPDDGERFVTRAINIRQHYAPDAEQWVSPETTHKRRRKWQGFDFSKTAPHSCCMYDKANEISVSHKEWLHDIWRDNGWDDEAPVVRVEFRYERDCLRDMDIECPYDLLDQLDSLWAYSSQKWLRHVTPDGDSNQSRWQLSAAWEVVQGATFRNIGAAPAIRQKKHELDAERLAAGTVGYLTSWAARSGLPLAVMDDGGGFLEAKVYAWMVQRLDSKATSFQRVVRDKAAKLGIQFHTMEG